MAFREFIFENVLDASKWVGVDATWAEVYTVRIIALTILGFVWGGVFQLIYLIADQLSLKFFPAYKTLNKIQRVDWTSRIVAMVFIALDQYQALQLWGLPSHDLIPIPGYDNSSFATGRWELDTSINNELLYQLFLYFSLVFGYELYDLKNCWDIRMYSGVIHHLVLLVIMPMNWSITLIAVPAVWMTATTYLTNIPAHIRSFMVHTGYRDIPLYTWNKWAWWLSYILFRLFGIPWYSAIMWSTMIPMRTQAPLFNIVFYFSSMAIHYSLSLYWFVEMTKTMFPVSDQMKRAGSYPTLPRHDPKKSAAGKGKSPSANGKGATSESESSDDEGGQKFD